MMKKQTYYFTGMHCAACATIARHFCDDIQGISCTDVSYKKGKVDVVVEDQSAAQSFLAAMNEQGYGLTDSLPAKTRGWKNISLAELFQVGAVVLALSIVWFLFAGHGRTNSLMRFVGSEGYITALLTGFVASVSTCLALTGGIVIGFSSVIDRSQKKFGNVSVQLLFQLGRIGGFFVLGGVLGLVGDMVRISVGVSMALTLFVGLVMIYLGAQMIGLLPSLSHRGITMPSGIQHRLRRYTSPALAPFIGAATFFVPCGFTQGMQLIALGSEDRLVGGMTMALFALGTAPVLFGLGMGASRVKNRSRTSTKKIIGLIVIVFGLYTLQSAFLLVGRRIPRFLTMQEGRAQGSDQLVVEKQQDSVAIDVIHNGRQIEDRNIHLPAHTPYEITIMPTSNGVGCMSHLIIPTLGKNSPEPILLNRPITIAGEGLSAGAYPIVCASMGMAMGSIRVQ